MRSTKMRVFALLTSARTAPVSGSFHWHGASPLAGPLASAPSLAAAWGFPRDALALDVSLAGMAAAARAPAGARARTSSSGSSSAHPTAAAAAVPARAWPHARMAARAARRGT